MPGEGTPWPAMPRTIWRMAPRPEVGSPKSDPDGVVDEAGFPQQAEQAAEHDQPASLEESAQDHFAKRQVQDGLRLRARDTGTRATLCRACTTSEAPEAPSAGSAAIAARPSNTRSRSSRNAPSETTRIMASPSLAPPVSMRTSATPSARCSTFWTASTFWMRPYGMCRSLRKMNPVRTTSSASSNRYR